MSICDDYTTNTNLAIDDDEDEDVEKLLEPFTKDHLVALIKKGVSKHLDLIEIVHELADVDPIHRKIFIHSLGWDTTVETLTLARLRIARRSPTTSLVSPKATPLFSSSTGVALGRLSSSPRSRSAIAPPHGRDLWPHPSVADILT
ncbi:ubp1-associated protein 2a [Quercus suber]|uniref:Ubp1-associated protein 2a n=1 Tax=Quercus suber TaxID=58331 RepID=A0AAW0JV14_QUESU